MSFARVFATAAALAITVWFIVLCTIMLLAALQGAEKVTLTQPYREWYWEMPILILIGVLAMVELTYRLVELKTEKRDP